MNNQLQKIENQIQVLEKDFTQLTLNNKAKIQFAQESHFALQALEKNNYLMSTAQKNPQSLKNAILNVASVGLTLNPVEKQAYLIPRNGSVVLDISYMGLCDLATQEGSLSLVKAQLVCEKDVFEFNGLTDQPTHKYLPFGDRGQVIGVYCLAKTPTGDFLTETMSKDDCYSIRDRSDAWKAYKAGKTKSCVWVTDEGEMMKKTVIKRAAKLWPKPANGSRLNSAIHVINQHEGISFNSEREVKTVEPQSLTEPSRKDIVLDEIKEFCRELTEGSSIQEKVSFMKEALGVSSFKELNDFSEEELDFLSNKLREMNIALEEGKIKDAESAF